MNRAAFMESDHGHGHMYYGVQLDGKLVSQGLDYETASFMVDALNATAEPEPCPDCGKTLMYSETATGEFPYGIAPNTVTLKATHRIMRCHGCGYMSSGEEGEIARQNVVDAYLQGLERQYERTGNDGTIPNEPRLPKSRTCYPAGS